MQILCEQKKNAHAYDALNVAGKRWRSTWQLK